MGSGIKIFVAALATCGLVLSACGLPLPDRFARQLRRTGAVHHPHAHALCPGRLCGSPDVPTGNCAFEHTFFPYFFAHPEELLEAGFIGFLAGKGLGDDTD